MKIAVDIDDTLSIVQRVKFAEAYIKRNHLPFEIIDPNAHVYQQVVNWSTEDAIKFINDGGIVVFTDAEIRKGARETMERWKAAGYELTILTARPKSWFVNPERISRDWLQKRKIPYDVLVCECEDKGKFCREHQIDILIDDNVDQCVSAQNNGVYAVLAAGRHCLKRLNEVGYSASDWDGIAKCVDDIIRKKGS